MAHVLALVGNLDAPPPSGYRLGAAFDCLLYRAGGDPLALELCFDSRSGRLIETIDRRGGRSRVATLRYERDAATTRVPPQQVRRLLRRLGAIH